MSPTVPRTATKAAVYFKCPACGRRRRNPTVYIDFERKQAHCGCVL